MNHRTPRNAVIALALILLALFVAWWIRREANPGDRAPETAALRKTEEAAKAETSAPSPSDGAHSSAPPVTPEVAALQGTLRGTVTDVLTGAPLANAEVYALQSSPYPKGDYCHSYSAKTDTAGAYSMDVVPAEYELDAGADTYVSLGAEKSVRWTIALIASNGQLPPDTPGEERELPRVEVAAAGVATYDVRLLPGATIRGLVTDEARQPIPGAKVRLQAHYIHGVGRSQGSGYPDLGKEPKSCTGDDSGRFRFGGIFPEGGVDLDVTAKGYAATTIRVEMTTRDPEVTIVLSKAPVLAGIVVDAEGKPVAGALLFLDSLNTLEARFENAAEDGTFRIEDPVRWCECLSAWSPGHGWAGVTLAGADTEHLRIVLPSPSGEIDGVVKDEHGALVAGARVVVTLLIRDNGPVHGVVAFRVPEDDGYNANGGIAVELPASVDSIRVTSDDRGEFVLKGLCVGDGCRVQIAVAHEGLCTKMQTVTAAGRVDVVMKHGDPEDVESEEDDEEELK